MTSALKRWRRGRDVWFSGMPRREIHAPALIDDRRLQRFGQLDEQLHARRRARRAVRDDHRVLRRRPACAPPRRRRRNRPAAAWSIVSFGMCRASVRGEIGLSCSSPSATSTTGTIGGVIAIL